MKLALKITAVIISAMNTLLSVASAALAALSLSVPALAFPAMVAAIALLFSTAAIVAVTLMFAADKAVRAALILGVVSVAAEIAAFVILFIF